MVAELTKDIVCVASYVLAKKSFNAKFASPCGTTSSGSGMNKAVELACITQEKDISVGTVGMLQTT